MTLGRLLLAWLPVTVWQTATASAWEVLSRRGHPATGGQGSAAAWTLAAVVVVAAGEAAVLTLLASLWFDSLGHGEWWLLFALLGLLQSLPAGHRPRSAPGAAANPLGEVLFGMARCVVAGGILAWRLG